MPFIKNRFLFILDKIFKLLDTNKNKKTGDKQNVNEVTILTTY